MTVRYLKYRSNTKQFRSSKRMLRLRVQVYTRAHGFHHLAPFQPDLIAKRIYDLAGRGNSLFDDQSPFVLGIFHQIPSMDCQLDFLVLNYLDHPVKNLRILFLSTGQPVNNTLNNFFLSFEFFRSKRLQMPIRSNQSFRRSPPNSIWTKYSIFNLQTLLLWPAMSI